MDTVFYELVSMVEIAVLLAKKIYELQKGDEQIYFIPPDAHLILDYVTYYGFASIGDFYHGEPREYTEEEQYLSPCSRLP